MKVILKKITKELERKYITRQRFKERKIKAEKSDRSNKRGGGRKAARESDI